MHQISLFFDFFPEEETVFLIECYDPNRSIEIISRQECSHEIDHERSFFVIGQAIVTFLTFLTVGYIEHSNRNREKSNKNRFHTRNYSYIFLMREIVNQITNNHDE